LLRGLAGVPWDSDLVSTDQQGEPSGAESDDDLDLARAASLWFILVGLIGFPIVGLTRGWHDAFRTGEMSVYLLGLGLAVLGEITIELVELGRATAKPTPKLWPAFRAGIRLQTTGSNPVGRRALAAFLPGLVVAAGILSGLAPSTRVLGLSTSATHVVAFIIGIATLAIIRFVVRKQPSS